MKKQKMNWKKRIALVGAATMLVGTLAVPVVAEEAEESYYEPKEHADVNYADMEYVGVDSADLDALLKELDELSSGKGEAEDPLKRTVELYEAIRAEYDEASTQSALGEILHYIHVDDEELSEKTVADDTLLTDMQDRALTSLRAALEGENGDDLNDCFNEEQRDYIRSYAPLTGKQKELQEREKKLEQEYDRLSEKEYSFEYKGKTWTMDELFANTPEDYDETTAIYMGIAKAENEAVVPIYLELVEVRKEIAKEAGYDNYVEYAYESMYGRDFTGEDIAALRETVINELIPVYQELRFNWYFSGFDTALPEAVSSDEILDAIEPRLAETIPPLAEAFSYMRKHGLYHIDNDENMIEAGFTTDLPQYGAEFIYMKTGGTIFDYETLVHEFGHYNAQYHVEQNALLDGFLVDVAEIQSQGLELLFVDQMKEILPDKGDGLQEYLVLNILDSVITGFEYDEFQQEVYTRDAMTADEINELAWEIDEKYTAYFYEEDGKAYEWTDINHNFTAPLYYISYATSALSALDIWSESNEDYASAVDKYMAISAVPLDVPYQEATVNCGLRNMMKEESIVELAEELTTWMQENGITEFSEEVTEEEDGMEHGLIEEDDPMQQLEELMEQNGVDWDSDGMVQGEVQQDVMELGSRLAKVSLLTNGFLWSTRIIALIVGLVAFFRRDKRNS